MNAIQPGRLRRIGSAGGLRRRLFWPLPFLILLLQAQSTQPLYRLAEADLITEDIARDAKTERFFLSSVRYGKVVSIDRDGVEQDFIKPGLPNIWSYFALQADSRRRVLWATTAAVPEFLNYNPADAGKSALLEFSLDSAKLLHRYDAPGPGKHNLGDMTLAPDGTLYISDGASGAVFRLAPKSQALEQLIAPGTFRSPQTPALSGGHLFIPDYPRGIFLFDLKSNAPPTLLPHPDGLQLGGIDGLYLNGRTLIAVQNGTIPNRIIAVTLDASLSKVDSWKPLVVDAAELGDPTHGLLFNNRFYFIAHAGWDNMGDDGKPKPNASFTPPEIRQLDL